MREHVLSPRDTLEKLSVYYRIPVCMIMRANNITKAPGKRIKKLKIPDRCYCRQQNGPDREIKECLPMEYEEYTVKKGDTIFEIAKNP